MNYDGLVLAAVVAELDGTLRGGRIRKIRQHNQTDVTLEIRGPGHTYLLFFSVDARFTRVYLTASSQPVPEQAPNFCMLLRKHIDGAYVAAIEQIGFDRIMRLTTQRHGEPQRTLHLEIMGKHSNLILLDENDIILGAAKHIGASVSRYRQVLPGREYLPPPGTDKLDFRALDASALEQLWEHAIPPITEPAQARQWLISTFSGFGPFLADEILARASSDGAISRNRVCEELLALGQAVSKRAFSPVLVTGERGEGQLVYPIPSVQIPPERQHPRTSMSEPLDALFRSLVTRTALDEEKTQTLTGIRRAIASRRQTLKSIERTIDESARAETHRQIGELILASLHTIGKGDSKASLVNYFDPAMPEIEVELDPKLTPQQNAERYFKRYQKARDAVSSSEARKAAILRETGLLETALAEAESAQSVEALESLRKTLTSQDLLRQEVRTEREAEEFGGFRIRRTYTPEGWEILHGETAQANDYLTQRVARPNDVWLHTRAITGAHVVIRTSGHTGEVPKPVLLQASLIAARNSDAKHSSLVPVDHTLRKYVRKPRGSAPGFVTYRNEKTIDITPKT